MANVITLTTPITGADAIFTKKEFAGEENNSFKQHAYVIQEDKGERSFIEGKLTPRSTTVFGIEDVVFNPSADLTIRDFSVDLVDFSVKFTIPHNKFELVDKLVQNTGTMVNPVISNPLKKALLEMTSGVINRDLNKTFFGNVSDANNPLGAGKSWLAQARLLNGGVVDLNNSYNFPLVTSAGVAQIGGIIDQTNILDNLKVIYTRTLKQIGRNKDFGILMSSKNYTDYELANTEVQTSVGYEKSGFNADFKAFLSRNVYEVSEFPDNWLLGTITPPSNSLGRNLVVQIYKGKENNMAGSLALGRVGLNEEYQISVKFKAGITALGNWSISGPSDLTVPLA